MKTKPTLRIFLASLIFALGFFSHALYQSLSGDKPTSTVPHPTKLDQEVRSLSSQLAEAQTENARLQNQLELESRPAEVVFEQPVAKGTQQAGSTMARQISFDGEHYKEMMARQVNRQMDIYATRLNLTEDQRNQMGEMMLLRFMQMRTSFNPDTQGIATIDQDNPRISQRDIDDLAAEILSDEQLIEYDEMRKQENASRSEMMATAQMSQIAPQLGLSEEQKNQVYGIYYNQTQDMLEEFTDPQQMREVQMEADEQIRKILDDEQTAVFEKLRENQQFGNFTIIAR